jgi:hypothetical protein
VTPLPTNTPTNSPTVTPKPVTDVPPPPPPPPRDDDDDDDDDDKRVWPTEGPSGRVTGTVIDERTGIPTPGVRVRVGDVIVVTDEYGNYEREHLEIGEYEIELLVDEEMGTPLQETQIVVVIDDTVVRHLYFRSPPPPTATPTASPTNTPSPTFTPLPADTPSPTMEMPIPVELPNTSGGGTPPWIFFVIGSMFVAAGALIWRWSSHPHTTS